MKAETAEKRVTHQEILRVKRIKYKFNETIRKAQVERSKAWVLRAKSYEEFRNLRKVRVDICNTVESIETYQKNLYALRARLKSLMRRKEELELAWGQVRAKLKKEKKENESRNQTANS